MTAVAVLGEQEARALTDRIKTAAERVWSLLLEANERRAWAALGYESWRAYAQGEFDMTQSRAYQLLDQAKVITALGEASSTTVEVSEREARDLKPVIDQVVVTIRERIKDVPAERVQEMVREVVTETRREVAEARENQRAVDEFNAATAHLVADRNAQRPWGEAVVSVSHALQRLPLDSDPAELAARCPKENRYRLDEIPAAVAWLNLLYQHSRAGAA